MPDKICRCEAIVPAVVLDGYACGNPDCWRTAEVKVSFDAFVVELLRKRDGAAPGDAVRVE